MTQSREMEPQQSDFHRRGPRLHLLLGQISLAGGPWPLTLRVQRSVFVIVLFLSEDRSTRTADELDPFLPRPNDTGVIYPASFKLPRDHRAMGARSLALDQPEGHPSYVAYWTRRYCKAPAGVERGHVAVRDYRL